ncbi:MATE family efflux transporter [Pseudogemmobacter sp. W21_MBD1_M6]|uniref:MATE family efflux transporter n=1 Tax=Pseudogemmobacter sp. W21_MBD1_M6 TaxID=3240271 RepID=UPI003F9A2373
MTYKGHARATLALGLPLVGSHVAQFAVHVTDTIMLGWYGIAELAAVVLGASSFFVIFIMGSGFALAVMPMVATAAGADDDVQVRRVTRMGIWLSLIYGVLVLPLFWYSGSLLVVLGQNPDIAAITQDYLRIAGFGILPALLAMVMKSYLAALERTQVVLWATIASVVLNAGLNWMLIFGNWGAPELGVRGAAIATIGTQLLSLVIILAYSALLPSLRRYTLFIRFWRPDWGAFADVFRLGWPIGLTNLAESALFAASALMMGWIGTRELAAHGIALEIASATFMVHLGLSNAATVRAGRAFGAGDQTGLRRGGVIAIALSVGVACLTILLFLGIPEVLIGAFLNETDPARPQIIAIGVSLLAVAALFQLADGAQVMALGLLRGVQDTRVPLVIAACSYWLVGVPASYVLGFTFGLGGPGIWLGLVIGLVLAAVLLMVRFWTGKGRAAVMVPRAGLIP